MLIPSLFGVGTALPVVVVAGVLAVSVESAAKILGAMTKIELWARWITGTILILIGINMTLRYIFNVV